MPSRLVRYAAVGIAATAVHYALLVATVEASWLRPPRSEEHTSELQSQ